MVARILYHLKKEVNIDLIRLDGGAVTTIPTDATAKIALDASDMDRAVEIAKHVADEVKLEHKQSDPGLPLTVARFETAELALDRNASDSVIDLLYLQPVGLVNSSLTFKSLPITSIALEVISTSENEIVWRYKPQSALKSKILDMEEQTKLLGRLCGVEYRILSRYFGHSIEAGSPLYRVYDEVWHEMTGNHLVPIGAHYGNEIGTFLERMPYLDVVLLVATHYDAHTPNERLDLASFDRCYECLVKILERI